MRVPPPTRRLRFRPMAIDDLDAMTALLSAPDPVQVDRPPRDRADAERWIAWQHRNYDEHGFGLWVIETHDGDFVGDCGLTVQDVEGSAHVEVGWHVLPTRRGRGLASEAGVAVREHARGLGIAHLVALIRPANTPSQRVAAHVGLRLERRAHVHGDDALVFGARLEGPSSPVG